MNHNTLENYYKVSYNLIHQHKFCSLFDLENMIPFERDIYMIMIKEEIEKQIEEQKQQKAIKEALERRAY